VPERLEELAPEQAPERAAAPASNVAKPDGALPGGMSIQKLLSMQRGAGR
jgi:hypothetical protein